MVRPVRSPRSNSRSRGSSRSPTGAASLATYSAVCRARARSEDHSSAGASPATYGATAAACAWPVSSSSTSLWPCARRSRFQEVWPCRSRTRVRSADDIGGQLDERAVAPEPLQGVELPLLLVLDVHHDL